MTRTRVAIFGGGIGGLTAAVALRQRGFEVSVYEQSPQLGEIGAGVGVAPNAVKAFRALGLERDLLAIGWTGEFQTMRNGVNGKIISRRPIADSAISSAPRTSPSTEPSFSTSSSGHYPVLHTHSSSVRFDRFASRWRRCTVCKRERNRKRHRRGRRWDLFGRSH